MGPLNILYLTTLYAIATRRPDARGVVDVLALNWAWGLLIWWAAGGIMPLLLWMAGDFIAGVWLLARHRGGSTGWRVGLCYAGMMAINGLAWALHGPAWQNPAITAMAWAQILVLAWGVWGDGLAAFDRPDRHRAGDRRDAGTRLPRILPLARKTEGRG